MKISFCLIAYNEAITLRANLTHLYPYAHEIIVCEGSVAMLRQIAGVGRRSNDGTTELLASFPDPDRKLRVIQNTWKDKNEMAAAYAEIATGDIIWHVDADEFYDPYTLRAVPKEFEDPTLSTLQIPMYVFWKSPEFVLADDEGQQRWFRYARVLRRVEAMSILHLPIRRLIDGQMDEEGLRDPTDERITGWHYAWNDDARVRLKMKLYSQRDVGSTRPDWLTNVWDRWQPDSPPHQWPNGVHPSRLWQLWPQRFQGTHPECVGEILGRLDVASPQEARL